VRLRLPGLVIGFPQIAMYLPNLQFNRAIDHGGTGAR
jgi:hypothetical protein